MDKRELASKIEFNEIVEDFKAQYGYINIEPKVLEIMKKIFYKVRGNIPTVKRDI